MAMSLKPGYAPITPGPERKRPSTPALRLAPLPYAFDALAPTISASTLRLHYEKHHRGYVDKLGELLTGTPLATLSLREIVLATAGDPASKAIFNNAAQAWNHDFYWRSLRIEGGGPPPATMRKLVVGSFGTVESFRNELLTAAATLFGSGWAWLVLEGAKLRVLTTGNADNPLTAQQRPLLAIDVWEHAYYLDHQNNRLNYLRGVLDKLLNWSFAAENLGNA